MACRFPGHLPVGDIATCASLQIADEVRAKGRCDRTLDEIGARGSLSTVRNAMRAAVQLGLVRVTERPQPGRKNLPNVVEVVSPEWRIWINRGPKPSRDRVQKADRHGYEGRKEAFQVEGARAVPSRPPGSSRPEPMIGTGACRRGRPD